MSDPQPQWLSSCLHESHLTLALSTLNSREKLREEARFAQIPSPNPRARISFRPFSRSSSGTTHLRDYFSCSVGQQPAHRRANRYLHVEPYNRTRVLVPSPDSNGRLKGNAAEVNVSETRYLNANWVREGAGGKWWIGGQAPLPNTAHAFLTPVIYPVAPPSASSQSSSSYVRARRVHTIVQLTPMIELGRRRADPYFPSTLRHDLIISPGLGCDAPPICVHVLREEKIDSAQCVRTDLRLRWDSAQSQSGAEDRVAEEWTVTHLYYTGWPDFGVPKDNRSIINFARLTERINNRHLDHPSNDPNASPPIIVHCSAGIGRTGSFIALCSLLRTYSLLSSRHTSSSSDPTPSVSLASPLPASPLGPLPDGLSHDLVAREIDGLREQRISMVQKREQVIWVYEALRDAFNGI